MGRNKLSDDVDHVLQDPKPTKKPKIPPPEPWEIPTFSPMEIASPPTYGHSIKLETDDPYEIFSLFLTEDALELIATNTNRNQELNPAPRSPYARKWHPTTAKELRAYIGAYIWMGVHVEPEIEDYWRKDPAKGPIHSQIGDHISRNRWEQIDRYLHISAPQTEAQRQGKKEKVFQKLEPLATDLRNAFKQYWQIGTHLTIDESIQRFLGRAAEVVNIPSKPTPEGFKIWCLANGGYVVDWLWHGKGSKAEDGPYKLPAHWMKEEGFSKTQAVVLELLARQLGLAKNKHIIWLDNLFTSHDLLAFMREYMGIGAAGTVRITKTKREEEEASRGTKAQKKRGKEKEENRGVDASLAELKNKFGPSIEWGKLYARVSGDQNIIQFGWKDQTLVLFMSTVSDGLKEVVRWRRRPAASSTSAKTSRAPFGDQPIKELPIPEFIDQYNHFMNGVDQADQLRSYYTTQRIHIKNWKSLWHFLLDTTIVNAYKIAVPSNNQSYPRIRKGSAHLAFRNDLAMGLFAHSERLDGSKPPAPTRTLQDLVVPAPVDAHEFAGKLTDGCPKDCLACRSAGRLNQDPKIKRKALGELNPNSLVGKKRRHRTKRPQSGCVLCNIHLCNTDQCWNEHISASEVKMHE